MKARDLTEFLDALDDEFAWRFKELTTLNSNIKTSPPVTKPMLIRCATALLYAHWEGFIKNVAEAYLHYVAIRKLQYSELSKAFIALSIRSKLLDLETDTHAEKHQSIVEFLLYDLDTRAKIPIQGTIKTKSNLNSLLFRDIVFTLGLNYSYYELKEQLIDAKLLNWRNSIAHGQGLCPKEADFDILFREILDILRKFKDQVSNAAAQKSYRREKKGHTNR